MFAKKLTARCMIAAISLCLAILLAGCGSKADPTQAPSQDESPSTGYVQMVNPLVTVNDLQEMEERLGYTVPTLAKDVEAYIVLVMNGTAEQGRIQYADGSVFNIKKGSEDVSGIYGGTKEYDKIFGSIVTNGNIVGGITVSFYVYEDIHYAIWEQNGFSFSLTGGEKLEDEVNALIQK